MIVVSTRELMQNQSKFFDLARSQRVIMKRKKRFYQLLDLGESIPEQDDAKMSKEDFLAMVDKGIKEYKEGKAKTLKPEDIHSFLGL